VGMKPSRPGVERSIGRTVVQRTPGRDRKLRPGAAEKSTGLNISWLAGRLTVGKHLAIVESICSDRVVVAGTWP